MFAVRFPELGAFQGQGERGDTGAPGSDFRPLTTGSSLWSERVRKRQ